MAARVRVRARVVAAVVASLAVVAGCGTSAAGPTTHPSATPAASASLAAPTLAPATPVWWSDCGNGFQCGFVDVPRDYAEPTGPTVRLSLIRLPALDQTRRVGSLVVNPGGPGGSGIDFVRSGATILFSKKLRTSFDIVGFDPRGVGASTPIRCVPDLDHFIPEDSTPNTPAELTNLLDGAKTFAEQCGERNADLLPHLATADVARDLDQIRASLGDAKLTYLGFSYGTLIGEVYASMFPGRIRALALDGVVDPALGEASFREQQAQAFEGALNRFLADCAAKSSCAFHSGGNPGAAFDALMNRIEAHPVPVLRLAAREPVGPPEAWAAVLQSLYSKEAWPLLADALSEAADGDGTLMLLLGDPLRGRNPDGSYSNLMDAYYAVTCLDWPASRDPAAYSKLATQFTKVAPRVGRLLAFNDIECAYWPTPAVRKPAKIAAPGAPAIVLVGTTGDVATPYAWAKRVAASMTSSVLVTRVGEGHTAYGDSACVRTAVDAYLLSLTSPKKNLRCT